MTSVSGLEFASAWERRLTVDFDGEPAGVISREDLLLSKKAAARLHDRKHHPNAAKNAQAEIAR